MVDRGPRAARARAARIWASPKRVAPLWGLGLLLPQGQATYSLPLRFANTRRVGCLEQSHLSFLSGFATGSMCCQAAATIGERGKRKALFFYRIFCGHIFQASDKVAFGAIPPSGQLAARGRVVCAKGAYPSRNF